MPLLRHHSGTADLASVEAITHGQYPFGQISQVYRGGDPVSQKELPVPAARVNVSIDKGGKDVVSLDVNDFRTLRYIHLSHGAHRDDSVALDHDGRVLQHGSARAVNQDASLDHLDRGGLGQAKGGTPEQQSQAAEGKYKVGRGVLLHAVFSLLNSTLLRLAQKIEDGLSEFLGTSSDDVGTRSGALDNKDLALRHQLSQGIQPFHPLVFPAAEQQC